MTLPHDYWRLARVFFEQVEQILQAGWVIIQTLWSGYVAEYFNMFSTQG
jgi:hypothetical protein